MVTLPSLLTAQDNLTSCSINALNSRFRRQFTYYELALHSAIVPNSYPEINEQLHYQSLTWATSAQSQMIQQE